MLLQKLVISVESVVGNISPLSASHLTLDDLRK